MTTFKSTRHLAMYEPTEDVEARYKRQRQELLDTTRRYHRTLADAFPDVRATAGYIPRRRAPLVTKPVVLVLIALAVVGVVLSV